MLSEFISALCQKVSIHLQSLEDALPQVPGNDGLHLRLVAVCFTLLGERLGNELPQGLFQAIALLRGRLQATTMTAEAFAALQSDSTAGEALHKGDVIDMDDDNRVSEGRSGGPGMEASASVAAASTAGMIASTPMASNIWGAKWVLSHEGVVLMQLLEKLWTACNELSTLKALVVSTLLPLHPTEVVHWGIPIPAMAEPAAFLHDALDNTTPSMDTATTTNGRGMHASVVVYLLFS